MSWIGISTNFKDDSEDVPVPASRLPASGMDKSSNREWTLKQTSRPKKVVSPKSEASQALAARLDMTAKLDATSDDALHEPEGAVTMKNNAGRTLLNQVFVKLTTQKENLKRELEARKEVRHNAAIKIQAWFKMCRVALFGPLAFLHYMKIAKRENAALTLQRIFRGHRTRHARQTMALIYFRLLEHKAALHVQRVARGHLGRMRFAEAKWQTEEGAMRRATVLFQKIARGWKARRDTKMRVQLMKETVCVLERFFTNWFRPWQKAQNKLWDKNMWSVVAVQKRVRRFLAKKRVKEIRKARNDMITSGIWMVGWLLLLGLLFLATVMERGTGGPAALRLSFAAHMDPSPASHLSAPHIQVLRISTPDLIWEWLQRTLLPQYQSIRMWPECNATKRQASCGDSGKSLPLHIVSQLTVVQKRAKEVLRELPGAGTVEIEGVCGAKVISGGVCIQGVSLPERETEQQSKSGGGSGGVARNSSDLHSAVWDGMGEKSASGANSIMEEGQKVAWRNQAKRWELGNYSRGAYYTMVRPSMLEDNVMQYGSALLNFTHESELGASMTGMYAGYPKGGYRLIPVLGNGSTLSLKDELATRCGVPCEQGIKRLHIARWIDGRTTAITSEVAVASVSANAFVIARTLIEMTPSGLIQAHTRLTSSRLQSFASFGDSDVVSAGLAPFVLFLFCGVAYLCISLFLSMYAVKIVSLTRIRLRPRESSRLRSIAAYISKGWNRFDLLVAFLVLLSLLLRAWAQSLCASLLSTVAPESTSSADMLAGAHAAADGSLAVAAMLIWFRGMQAYVSSVRIMRAFYAVSLRLVMPLVALLIVTFPVVMALSHSAVVSKGFQDSRNAGFRNTLGSVIDMMVDASLVGEEPKWTQTGRRLRAGIMSGRAIGATGGGWMPGLEALAFLLGLVITSSIGAFALVELEVEQLVTRDMEKSPYLYGTGRRFDRYKAWEIPQVIELIARLKQLVKSRVSHAEELRMNMMQASVLIQLRKHGIGNKKRKFGWRLLHSRHRLLVARQTRANLRHLSRRMGLQLREFNKSADLLEFAMDEMTPGMFRNASTLLRKDFALSEFKWPKARVSSEELRNAQRIVDEEKEKELDAIVCVQGKKLRQMDLQIRQASEKVASITDIWYKSLAHDDRIVLDKNKRRRNRG